MLTLPVLHRSLLSLLLLFGFSASPVSGQRISDIKIRYLMMHIPQAELEEVGTIDVDHFRHNIFLEVGVGQAFAGLQYQHATKGPDSQAGVPESGMMLTAGYNYIFSTNFRLDFYGRAKVWGTTDPSQPLFATDTDLRVNLHSFLPDGIGRLGNRPLFPSAYAGFIINRYGRVQQVGGAGVWWNKISMYLTGFVAYNGVKDISHPGENGDRTFAYLKNSAYTLTFQYTFEELQLEVSKTIPIQNSGNDLSISLTYRHFFKTKRRGNSL